MSPLTAAAPLVLPMFMITIMQGLFLPVLSLKRPLELRDLLTSVAILLCRTDRSLEAFTHPLCVMCLLTFWTTPMAALMFMLDETSILLKLLSMLVLIAEWFVMVWVSPEKSFAPAPLSLVPSLLRRRPCLLEVRVVEPLRPPPKTLKNVTLNTLTLA